MDERELPASSGGDRKPTDVERRAPGRATRWRINIGADAIWYVVRSSPRQFCPLSNRHSHILGGPR